MAKRTVVKLRVITGQTFSLDVSRFDEVFSSTPNLIFDIVFSVFVALISPYVVPEIPNPWVRLVCWVGGLLIYYAYFRGLFFLIARLGRDGEPPVYHTLYTIVTAVPTALCVIWVVDYLLEDHITIIERPLTAFDFLKWMVIGELGQIACLSIIWTVLNLREEVDGDVVARAAEREFVVLGGESFKLGSILMVRSAEHYLQIETTLGPRQVRERMKTFLEQVGPKDGIQSHRSFWVSHQAIERIDAKGIHTTLGQAIPIARGRRQSVEAWMSQNWTAPKA